MANQQSGSETPGVDCGTEWPTTSQDPKLPEWIVEQNGEPPVRIRNSRSGLWNGMANHQSGSETPGVDCGTEWPTTNQDPKLPEWIVEWNGQPPVRIRNSRSGLWNGMANHQSGSETPGVDCGTKWPTTSQDPKLPEWIAEENGEPQVRIRNSRRRLWNGIANHQSGSETPGVDCGTEWPTTNQDPKLPEWIVEQNGEPPVRIRNSRSGLWNGMGNHQSGSETPGVDCGTEWPTTNQDPKLPEWIVERNGQPPVRIRNSRSGLWNGMANHQSGSETPGVDCGTEWPT